MNYKDAFLRLNPGFFEQEHIRTLPENEVYSELILDLRCALPDIPLPPCPENIHFGRYQGSMAPLRQAVSLVDEEWVQYFNKEDACFCAFDGEKIVAFCSISAMGKVDGLSVSGPGCVGTIPAYRRQGIGLKLVQLATKEIKKDGYALSWIHYTYLPKWYMKLGYQPVLRWNCNGFL